MSIPRAKITYGPGSIPTSHWWFYRCASCGTWGRRYDAADAMGSAHRHLLEEHGVRTVGSLTADDIGKWIDLGDYAGILDRFHARAGEVFIYVSKPVGRTINPDLRVIETAQWWPSSTPCRVTEERP